MLQSALDAIPEDFATAVELHDIDGFKYHEIADIVGVPIGTVMSRISRGRRLLAGVIVERRAEWALGTSADPAAREGRALGSMRRRPL
jgi:RNA polymerase sigma-70 factor (ECF subfamily)